MAGASSTLRPYGHSTQPRRTSFPTGHALYVLLEARYHRDIVIDYPVHDRIENSLRTPAQQLQHGLQPPAHPIQGRSFAVAHRHHEVFSYKSVEFTELHCLRLVDVTSRFQDCEERLSVAFNLGVLMASSTASGCSPNSAATEQNSSSVGSTSP